MLAAKACCDNSLALDIDCAIETSPSAPGATLMFTVAVSQLTGRVEPVHAVGAETRQPYSSETTALAENPGAQAGTPSLGRVFLTARHAQLSNPAYGGGCC